MNAVGAPLLLLAAVLACCWHPSAWPAAERLVTRALGRPRSPAAFAAALAASVLAVEALVGWGIGIPQPRIHDEFSYLLAGDTFAHGRLSNPTHPLWRHFETFHVLLQPTYASKYPPGQGMALAAGEWLGAPILGVWISGALFCAAAAWMLHGWLRPRWARLGALLLALTVAVATAWDQGYRGGFVAGAGGALVFGAAARLLRRPRWHDGMALGMGAFVLAVSRPWEGVVATAAAIAPVTWRALRSAPLRRALLSPALVTAAIVVAGAAWLAYYDWRVTGSPWELPYQLHDRRYAAVPIFLWQPLRTVEPSPHEAMARFFRDFEGGEWRRQHTLAGWTAATVRKTRDIWVFFVGAALSPLLVGLPWALRRHGPRRAAAAAATLFASQLVILPSHPHYVAPGAVLLACLLVEGGRELRLWRPAGTRLGARLAAMVPLLALLSIPLRAWDLRQPLDEWHLRRAALAWRLAALPGRQLVLVRYSHGHDWLAEWVYNDADLRGTRVLWARFMGAAEDCRLLAWERHRTPWLLDVVEELTPPRLRPYPRRACAGARAAAGPLPSSTSPDEEPNVTRRPSTRQGSVSSRRSASG